MSRPVYYNANDVCRGCLAPRSITELLSLGSDAELLQIFWFSKVDFLPDATNKTDGVSMCKVCIDKMKLAFDFHMQLQNNESNFFSPQRKLVQEVKRISSVCSLCGSLMNINKIAEHMEKVHIKMIPYLCDLLKPRLP